MPLSQAQTKVRKISGVIRSIGLATLRVLNGIALVIYSIEIKDDFFLCRRVLRVNSEEFNTSLHIFFFNMFIWST